jgi:hypothetical protein
MFIAVRLTFMKPDPEGGRIGYNIQPHYKLKALKPTIVTPEIRNIGQIVEILKFTQYDYEEKTKELQQRV